MINYHVVIDTREPDLDTFYVDIKGTRYQYMEILDLKKLSVSVEKKVIEDEEGNPKFIEQQIDVNPEIEFIPGHRYLVMGVKAYQFVKDRIHLGPRGENFYDLTKMEYLLTRSGVVFKFCYVNYKRCSEFISKSQYDTLFPNQDKLRKRLKWCELESNISKRTGKPYYMMVYFKLEDVDGTIAEFLDKEDLLHPTPQMNPSKLVREVRDIREAFKSLMAHNGDYGLDYETNGFPFDDPDFYHMGVGIVTNLGEGYYFDMDWMQSEAEKGNTEPWEDFKECYKEFNDEKAEYCYTYNVSFEQRCTYLLYGVLYFYHESAAINKLESLVKKNYSLKYTAMRSLYVASWDDDFEWLSDVMGELMAWKNPEVTYEPSNVFYTSSLDEVKRWERYPETEEVYNDWYAKLPEDNPWKTQYKQFDEKLSGQVLAGEYQRLDCEVLYYTESPIWKEMRERFPDLIDEFKWMFEERWGFPFKCIPAKVHNQYCPLDSFYTVKLKEKALEKYTQLAWDCFDNNLRMGALLGIHGIPLDEDYRQKLEDMSTSQILWSKLNLCKWYLHYKTDNVPQELVTFEGWTKIWSSKIDIYNLQSLLNKVIDPNKILSYPLMVKNYGVQIACWIVENVGTSLEIEFDSKDFQKLQKDYQTWISQNIAATQSKEILEEKFWKSPENSFLYASWDPEIRKRYEKLITQHSSENPNQGRLLYLKWFDKETFLDIDLDQIYEYYSYKALLKQIDYLMTQVDQNTPNLVYKFLDSDGSIVEKDGYEISAWIKGCIYNFNSSNNFLDMCLMVYNYYNEPIKEMYDWDPETQFEEDPELDERFRKITQITGSPLMETEIGDMEVIKTDEVGNPICDENDQPIILETLKKTIRDQYLEDYPMYRYETFLKKYILSLGVVTCRIYHQEADEKGNLVSWYDEEEFDVANSSEVRDYKIEGDILHCFLRLCEKEGLFWEAEGLDDEGNIIKKFKGPWLEEPYWELPASSSAGESIYWLCITSARDRVISNYTTKKAFERLYDNSSIMEKSIMGLTMWQYHFTNFRKYEKVLSTYINGQFTKYTTTANKEDENLICTERWYDEEHYSEKHLKVFSPYKVCEKQSKRWSAPMHTVPSKSEVKRCVTTPPGYLLSYFDISGAEIRTIAFMSNSKFFQECYDQGKDVYIEAAKIVEPGEDLSYYKGRRPTYKQILLGRIFGMGDEKMADMTDSTLEESIDRGNKMFALMPEVEQLIQEKAQYCVDHEGMCETFLGDTMYFEGKRSDQWQRLGINQAVQGFTAIALADGFFNIIYVSYKEKKIIVRPVNVVHDSSQNLFETKKLFEISGFYTENMRKYLYDKYKVDWDFETEVGANYYDMVGIENETPTKLKLSGTYTAIKRLLDKCKQDGLGFSIESFIDGDGNELTLTNDENYAEGFVSDIPKWGLKQSISQFKVAAMYEFDKSKYKVVINKEEIPA